MLGLAGKHVVVTGAGQGIGAAIAECAAALGAKVTIVGRKASALEEVASRMPRERVLVAPGDVSDVASVERIVAAASAAFGRIHGLVNNAGISRPDMIVNMPVAKWHEVLATNLTGSFYFLQAIGRHFIASHAADKLRSSIVNVSSVAGRRGTVGQANYAASKAGMLALTMSAAREWGRYGVRANSVCFGVVETPMTETVRARFRDHYLQQIPLGTFATPGEVAPSVCFLLSDAASYVTGQHLSVDGGLHIGY